MANFQDIHYHTPSDGMDSQHVSSAGRVKSSLTFIGGTCLVLLSILTLSVYTSTFHSTSASQSTSLFGVLKPMANSHSGLAASPFTLYNNKMNNQPRGFRIRAQAVSEFEPGQKAEYLSASNGRWIPCKITSVDPSTGKVEIDVKKGFPLDVQTQKQSLRKVNSLFSFFKVPEYKPYDPNSLGNPEDYKPGSKSEGYARARQRMEKYRQEAQEREGKKTPDLANLKAPGFLSQVTGALDFQENIKEDRGLLNSASQLRKGEKLSDAQYGAVRRKVGGTKGGFFGETVEVEGAYTDKGYVDKDATPWWERLKLR